MVRFSPVIYIRVQSHRYVVSAAGSKHLLPELRFLAEATKGSIPMLYESCEARGKPSTWFLRDQKHLKYM